MSLALKPDFSRARLMIILVVLVLFTMTALAQETKPETTEKKPPGTQEAATPSYGPISGQVISEEGPVPFANIIIIPVANRGRGNAPRTTTTDAEGNFRVDGLRAGAWQVIANAQGYVIEPSNDEAEAEAFHRIGEQITIRMTKGGVITGKVVNAGGEPVIAVPVSVQMVRDQFGRPASGGSTGGGFQTDDRGVYRIYGLMPGSYVVVAGRTAGVGLEPGGGGFAPGNRPIPYDGDVATYYPSATRDTAMEVAVSSGLVMSGIDIQYRGDRGRAISGKITGAVADNSAVGGRGGFGGGPGGGALSVTLSHAATGTVFNRVMVMSRGGSAANSYAIYGVPDGEYEVTGERISPGGNNVASAPRRVLVSGRDASGIDLTLMPLASINARLQLENENKAVKCETSHKASFEEQLFVLQAEEAKATTARQPNRLAFIGGYSTRPIAPDRTGEMNFRNLTTGRYHLDTKLLDDNWYIRSITLPGAPVKATAKAPAKTTTLDVARNGVSLKSGDKLTGLTVKVSEGAAAVKGKVKPGENMSLPPLLRVFLVPVEKERADDVLRYAEVATSQDGSFTLSNLAPGKYWLLPRMEMEDAQKKIRDNGERAKLRQAAEAANVVVELQPCQRLSNYELPLK